MSAQCWAWPDGSLARHDPAARHRARGAPERLGRAPSRKRDSAHQCARDDELEVVLLLLRAPYDYALGANASRAEPASAAGSVPREAAASACSRGTPATRRRLTSAPGTPA
jgi:hypothetical protein